MRSSSSGAEVESSSAPFNPSSSEWKREANHRLAAHRARRDKHHSLQHPLPGMEAIEGTTVAASEPVVRPRGKNVADRVAARYAQAPSYSEMLAAEARNAVRAAEAAAVAAGEARDAAQAILSGLNLETQEGLDEELLYESGPGNVPQTSKDLTAARRFERHSQMAAEHQASTHPASIHRDSIHQDSTHQPSVLEQLDELEREEPIAPIQPLPAKLLEFPRELVAARKARPRLAEGPLREEYDRETSQSQLRIFEVEQESISTQPAVEQVLPGWSTIRLDSAASRDAPRSGGFFEQLQEHRSSPPVAERRPAASAFELPLQTASLEDRLMASLVDLLLVVAGFLLFIFVFVACTTHPPTGKPAMIGAAVAFFCFGLLYQLLFFCFGSDTPGMRYTKIALCTFDDENPTRQAMRQRVGALLLSASPLGLGILWAFFDDDRLGWHDRISRTYQRSYR
ncbi:RDD family protein [Acidisarcina polymorpha]|uniref:RDD family protein n=1 Tax=Acidisarcina polymorpha TaxID=2211140 RepID=UPI001237C44F|nr:RDD family protein [Acidisarcina polymorpha]